jgi:hypothetical protein
MFSPHPARQRKLASAISHEQGGSMAKFRRFEFGKDKPSERYEADHTMPEKGYVKIIRGRLDLIDFETERSDSFRQRAEYARDRNGLRHGSICISRFLRRSPEEAKRERELEIRQ